MCLVLKIPSEMAEFGVGFIIPVCFLAVRHDKETTAPNASIIIFLKGFASLFS